MIVKQIESQSREPNYFQALISYLLNPQGKEHRVGTARLSNYDSEDVKGARFETAVLQKQNTRAKSSDTMHLVVSFPAGEVPSKEVLEKRLLFLMKINEKPRKNDANASISRQKRAGKSIAQKITKLPKSPCI